MSSEEKNSDYSQVETDRLKDNSNGTTPDSTKEIPENPSQNMDLENHEDVLNYVNDVPAQVEKHLEFIIANKRGHLLMGSSNLNGRYWSGSVWYYEDPSHAPSVEKSKAGIEFHSGMADGIFIDDQRAVIGMDCGTLEYLSLDATEENANFVKLHSTVSHAAPISSVDKSCDSKTILSSSLDMSVRLWDAETTKCLYIFSPAHTQEISSLSAHPHHPEIFLSCALDGNILLWDIRSPKPASCVFRDIDDCPSSVSWVTLDCGSSYDFVVGTLSGVLHLRKATLLSHSLHSSNIFTRSIYRIKPNPLRSNQLAICADDTKVLVAYIEEERIFVSYKDDSHNDFVRGLSWLEKKKFMSCGWDKQVVTHVF